MSDEDLYAGLFRYDRDGNIHEIKFAGVTEFPDYLSLLAEVYAGSAEKLDEVDDDQELKEEAEHFIRASRLLLEISQHLRESDDLPCAMSMWNLALDLQRYECSLSKFKVRHGFKMWSHIKSAPRRSPVTNEDVERVLAELRRNNPRLSETSLRKLTAKELGVGLSTVLRRLEKKK
jgi:hypothetical protein